MFHCKSTEISAGDRKTIAFCPVFGPILNQLDFFCRREKIISPPKIDSGSPLNQVSSATKKASKRNSFGASFRRATRAVSEAIAIKPKVTLAKDPLRLSTKPGRIGPDLYVATARVFENQGQAGKARYVARHGRDLSDLQLVTCCNTYHPPRSCGPSTIPRRSRANQTTPRRLPSLAHWLRVSAALVPKPRIPFQQ